MAWLNDSGSVVSNNLWLICYTYKIPKLCNTNLIPLFAKQTCNSDNFDYDLFVSNRIRELLYMRDYKSTLFDYEEINHLLNYACKS